MDEFTEWAAAQGVKTNGIAAHRFPGKGLGIIAERSLAAGCEILKIPTSVLRTAQTVPKSLSKPIGVTKAHSLLAADLTMDSSEFYASWRAVLPLKEDFESIPLMWHPLLQAHLPPAALSLLERQKEKLSADWVAAFAAFPSLSYDLYVYNWLIVNTRTFFYTNAKMKARGPLQRDECLALVPLADLFNHAATGCEVTFSHTGYEIYTDRQIEKGEEIYVSYGSHSNDLLLAEYGFLLDENRWDEISIDEFILPLFSEEQTRKLKESGFYAKYVLDKDTTCYRVQVALRVICMTPRRWQHLVANGLDAREKIHQAAVDGVLVKAFNAYLTNVHERLQQVEMLDSGLPTQREMLLRRWKQIRGLLTTAISRIER